MRYFIVLILATLLSLSVFNFTNDQRHFNMDYIRAEDTTVNVVRYTSDAVDSVTNFNINFHLIFIERCSVKDLVLIPP